MATLGWGNRGCAKDAVQNDKTKDLLRREANRGEERADMAEMKDAVGKGMLLGPGRWVYVACVW